MSLQCQLFLGGAQLSFLGGRPKRGIPAPSPRYPSFSVGVNLASAPNMEQLSGSPARIFSGQLQVPQGSRDFVAVLSSFCMSHLSKSGLGAGAARLHSAWAHVAKERAGWPGGRRGDAEGKRDGDRDRIGLSRMRQDLHLILPTHTSLLPDISDHLPCLTLTSYL